MPNLFNDDFRDFIRSLNDNGVEYILVGGYSVILNGYHRSTGDMDIWINKTETNYQKLEKAFADFGMPVFDMTRDNFLHNSSIDVFTFGRPPSSIDILNVVKGLDFKEAFLRSEMYDESDLLIRFIHIDDLIKAKKASGRNKDLNDIENLADKK